MALRLAPLVRASGSGATIAAGASARRYARESPVGIMTAEVTKRTTGGLLCASPGIRRRTPPAPARGARARRGCGRAGCALPRAATLTPRAWNPTSAPRERSRSACPAHRATALSKRPERVGVRGPWQGVVDREKEDAVPFRLALAHDPPPHPRGLFPVQIAGIVAGRELPERPDVGAASARARMGAPAAGVLGRELGNRRWRREADRRRSPSPRVALRYFRKRPSGNRERRPASASRNTPRRGKVPSTMSSRFSPGPSGSIQRGPGSDSCRKNRAWAVPARRRFSSFSFSQAGRVATTSPMGSISQATPRTLRRESMPETTIAASMAARTR